MSTAIRQARYVERQREAGRHRWTVWLTDYEHRALEVELTRLRDGEHMAAARARQLGVRRADLVD